MEGIQHRWDCPTPDAEPQTYDPIHHLDGAVTAWTRCPGCGRAAVVHKPKETADEQR